MDYWVLVAVMAVLAIAAGMGAGLVLTKEAFTRSVCQGAIGMIALVAGLLSVGMIIGAVYAGFAATARSLLFLLLWPAIFLAAFGDPIGMIGIMTFSVLAGCVGALVAACRSRGRREVDRKQAVLKGATIGWIAGFSVPVVAILLLSAVNG